MSFSLAYSQIVEYHVALLSDRLFDLAHGYPFSEVSFAKALSDSGLPRESVFVTTKLQPKYLGYNETLYAIDLSLENLKTSYIDLYLIHSKECDDFLLTCCEGKSLLFTFLFSNYLISWYRKNHSRSSG